MTITEAATKKKRGRPQKLTEDFYSIVPEMEKRPAQNFYYAGVAIELMNEQPGGFFVSEKGKLRRNGIAEQIGRMFAQDGFSKAKCEEIYEMAKHLYKHGYQVKTIEKIIRRGRMTGDF